MRNFWIVNFVKVFAHVVLLKLLLIGTLFRHNAHCLHVHEFPMVGLEHRRLNGDMSTYTGFVFFLHSHCLRRTPTRPMHGMMHGVVFKKVIKIVHLMGVPREFGDNLTQRLQLIPARCPHRH